MDLERQQNPVETDPQGLVHQHGEIIGIVGPHEQDCQFADVQNEAVGPNLEELLDRFWGKRVRITIELLPKSDN